MPSAGRSRSARPFRGPEAVNRRVRSGVIPEHSYGVRPVNAHGLIARDLRVEFGGGSASAVVDVGVVTHMRGLVPHDRVCEMRSGAVCLASSVARWGPLSVFSRVAPRVVAPVRSPRRAVDRGVYSIVASAQQCPASSRATATTTIERGLPRLSSACQRVCSRRALRSA
jgi:hypothetical protein